MLGVTRGTLHGSAEGRCGVTGPMSTGHGAWGHRHCGAANNRIVCKAQLAQEGSVKLQCPHQCWLRCLGCSVIMPILPMRETLKEDEVRATMCQALQQACDTGASCTTWQKLF